MQEKLRFGSWKIRMGGVFFWFSIQTHKIYSSNKGKGGRKIGDFAPIEIKFELL